MKKEKRSWKCIEVSGWIYGSKKELAQYEQIWISLGKAAWDVFRMTADSKGIKFKQE